MSCSPKKPLFNPMPTQTMGITKLVQAKKAVKVITTLMNRK